MNKKIAGWLNGHQMLDFDGVPAEAFESPLGFGIVLKLNSPYQMHTALRMVMMKRREMWKNLPSNWYVGWIDAA